MNPNPNNQQEMTPQERAALIAEFNQFGLKGQPKPLTALDAKLNRGSALLSLNVSREVSKAAQPQE